MKKVKNLPRREVFVRSGDSVVIGGDDEAAAAVDAALPLPAADGDAVEVGGDVETVRKPRR